MVCIHCNATISDGARFCRACGESQNVSTNSSNLSVLETVRLTLVEQEAKQQVLFAQLRYEIDTKFIQLYTEMTQQQKELESRFKALEPEIQAKGGLSRTVSTIILTVLVVAGVGFTWLLYTVINYKSNIQSDAITIMSIVLTIIGTLYLGYDLLGRQHGPLLWLTLFATSGLAGAAILEPLALAMALTHVVPLALQVTLFGAVLGAFNGLLFGPDQITKGPRFSLKSCLLGVVIGVAFWFMFLSIFSPNYRLNSLLIYLMLATILGVPLGAILGGFRTFIAYEAPTSKSRPSIISWKSCLKGFVIGLFVWGLLLTGVYLFAPASDANSLIENLIIVLILSLAGAASGGIARFAFWWVNHLPERILGAFGLILVLIGAILPIVQPLFSILNAIGKL